MHSHVFSLFNISILAQSEKVTGTILSPPPIASCLTSLFFLLIIHHVQSQFVCIANKSNSAWFYNINTTTKSVFAPPELHVWKSDLFISVAIIPCPFFQPKLAISNWIQIVNFSAFVTLKIDGWPQKTIGHIFYTMSSCVNHFESIGEFNLELQSGNAQFGSILAIFSPVWPCNLMDNIGKQ